MISILSLLITLQLQYDYAATIDIFITSSSAQFATSAFLVTLRRVSLAIVSARLLHKALSLTFPFYVSSLLLFVYRRTSSLDLRSSVRRVAQLPFLFRMR